MKRMTRMIGISLAVLLVSGAAQATIFSWNDDKGALHSTDRLNTLPQKYRDVFQANLDHFVSPEGVGFEKDESGNYRFYDHGSPAKRKAAEQAPPPNDAGEVEGSRVSVQEFADVKQGYREWGKEPRPETERVKVKRMVSGDTFELQDGRKVKYIGIEFPEELKGETKIHKEVVDYQEKMMHGREIVLLFGEQRQDDKGRVLAFVFVGTDMFLNADLVMNGYARVKTVAPNNEYSDLFARLQGFAKKSGLGIWNRGGLPADSNPIKASAQPAQLNPLIPAPATAPGAPASNGAAAAPTAAAAPAGPMVPAEPVPPLNPIKPAATKPATIKTK